MMCPRRKGDSGRGGALCRCLLVFLAIAPLSAVRDHKRAHASVPTELFGVIHAQQEFDCLRALLNDSDAFNLLEDALSYNSLWRIGTRKEPAGFLHSFHFAGRKRSMERVSLYSILVATDAPGGSEVMPATFGIGSSPIGEPPIIGDQRGLYILRDAMNDAGVRGEVLRSIARAQEGIVLARIAQSASSGELVLTLKGPIVDAREQLVITWLVRFDPATSKYVFYFD